MGGSSGEGMVCNVAAEEIKEVKAKPLVIRNCLV